MKADFGTWFKRFVIELMLYTLLVTGYYFAVLHFLGPSLQRFYLHERRVYAGLALLLIAGQGLVLELLTRVLLGLLGSGRDEP